MKKIISVVILLMSVSQIWATGQYSERLNYNGENVQLYSLLLELNDELFGDVKKRLPEGVFSTALWRNYIGHWKIENDSLFLDSIAVFQDEKLRALNIDDLVLKYQLPDGRIFCSWVSDTLRIAKGESVRYEHMGWDRNNEYEWDILLKNGIVKKITSYQNKIIARGISSDAMMFKLFSEFPIEKYPNVSRIVFTISNVNIDSDYNIKSYEVELLRVSPQNSISEEMSQTVIDDIKNVLKNRSIIPVSIIRGRLYFAKYVFFISRERIEEYRKK